MQTLNLLAFITNAAAVVTGLAFNQLNALHAVNIMFAVYFGRAYLKGASNGK